MLEKYVRIGHSLNMSESGDFATERAEMSAAVERVKSARDMSSREAKVAASYRRSAEYAVDPVHRKTYGEYAVAYQGLANKALEQLLYKGIRSEIEAFRADQRQFLDLHLGEADFYGALGYLGATTAKGSDILAYHFTNTESGKTVFSDDNLRTSFEHAKTLQVSDLFDILADRQDIMSTDNPNDYRATIAFARGETVVIVGQRQEECSLICEECYDRIGEENDDGTIISRDYSCRHNEGEYDYIKNYWLGLIKLDEFEDRPDWTEWEVDGKAKNHRTERKLGVQNGTIELQELEVGDVLRVVAEDTKGSYMYEFDILSARSEPTARIKQTNPDGSVVDGGDTEVVLRGTGTQVGREWPLYKDQGHGKTQTLINYGRVQVGGEMVIYDPSQEIGEDGLIMKVLQPAVTSIKLVRSKR